MKRTLICLALLAAPWGMHVAGAQEVRTTRLAEHTLVWTQLYPGGGMSNSTVFASSDGLVVVDPPDDPGQAQQLRRDVTEALGPREIRYVINTHEHLGHLGGDAFPEAKRIAHAGLTAELIDRNRGYARDTVARLEKQIEAAPEAEAARLRKTLEDDQAYLARFDSFTFTEPELAFTDRLTVRSGDATLRLIYFGKGHSDTDVLVYFPADGVLAVGGAVNPFLGIPGRPEADWRRWIDVLAELTAPDAGVSHVVAGHWEHDLIGKEYLAFLRDYLRGLFEGVMEAKRGGMDVEQASEKLSLSSPPFVELPMLRDVVEADRYRALRELVLHLSGSKASPGAAMAEWIASRHQENIKKAWGIVGL